MPLETNLRLEQQRVSPFVSKQPAAGKPPMQLSKFIPNMKISMFLILVVQIVTLILVINPVNVLNQLNVVNIINEASKLASLPPTEVPVVAVIGDNKLLPSVDEIRKQNDFASDIYKDAQNGDYVLAYTSKMVIYRTSEKKIIYEGDTPASKQSKLQQAASDAITTKAKSDGLIAQDSTETPALSVIVDPEAVKGSNQSFYADVQKDDIIATFSSSKLLIVYRPATKAIINSGKYTTVVE